MRTFYVFKVNDIFLHFYYDKSNVLYKMFEEIYTSNKDDFINNFRLFEKITLLFDKKMLNDYISLKHTDNLYYTKKSNIHMIENSEESSLITVNKTYLKIVSDLNMNTFMKDIINFDEQLFVIDFTNKDYFWINRSLNKVLV